MMKLRILLVLVLFILIISCVSIEEQPLNFLSDSKTEGATTTTPKTTQQEKSTIISTSGSSKPFIKTIFCNKDGLLKFTLTNPYTQKFALKSIPAFEAEALNILLTRVTVNGRQFENLESLCDKDLLEKDGITVCEYSFTPNDRHEEVMIRTQTESSLYSHKNSMRFVAPGYGYEATFICE